MRFILPLLLPAGPSCADEPQVWTHRGAQTFTGDFLAMRPGKVHVRGKKEIHANPMAKLKDACLAEAG